MAQLHELFFKGDQAVAMMDLDHAIEVVTVFPLAGHEPESVREVTRRLYHDRKALLANDSFNNAILEALPHISEDTPWQKGSFFPFTNRTLTAITPSVVLERIRDYVIEGAGSGAVREVPILTRFYQEEEINDANLMLAKRGIIWTGESRRKLN